MKKKLAAILIVAGIIAVDAAAVARTPANAGLRCRYIVEKTQARSVEQANLNSAAAGGWKLAQLTRRQTVLVKCGG